MKVADIGTRMKRYEGVTQTTLMPRSPAIIRLDGKAFHTFTKVNKCDRPYCEKLHYAMSRTTQELVDNIQGAVFAYTQSDEISILLRDWDTLSTCSWFDGKIQKIASISASMATARFNQRFQSETDALFDSRVFNIPLAEVTNYFVWRQQDATRNSIQMLGQSKFSHKQLHGKNVSQIQDMLMEQHNINWNDCQTKFKRGTVIYNPNKLPTAVEPVEGQRRDPVTIDTDCPIFTADRRYIERFLLL